MYNRACELFGFDAAARERGDVALCASHIDDLRAAAKQGVRPRSLSPDLPPRLDSCAALTPAVRRPLAAPHDLHPPRDRGRRDRARRRRRAEQARRRRGRRRHPRDWRDCAVGAVAGAWNVHLCSLGVQRRAREGLLQSCESWLNSRGRALEPLGSERAHAARRPPRSSLRARKRSAAAGAASAHEIELVEG